MHAVVVAEKIENLDEYLSSLDLESCDLYVQEWSKKSIILECLQIIKNNFKNDVYLITKNIPIPDWAFELGATVSVLWDDQNPSDLAVCSGEIEIDLFSSKNLHVLDNLKNIKHFLSFEDIKVNKKCLKKNKREIAVIQNADSINTNDPHGYLQ